MSPHAGSIERATVAYRTADVKGIPWRSASSHLRCSSQTPARHSTLFRCFLHQPSPGQNEMVLANRGRKAGYFHNSTQRMRLRHWPLSMLAPDTSPSISSEIGSIYGTIKANMTSHSRAARVALPRPISLLMPRRAVCAVPLAGLVGPMVHAHAGHSQSYLRLPAIQKPRREPYESDLTA